MAEFDLGLILDGHSLRQGLLIIECTATLVRRDMSDRREVLIEEGDPGLSLGSLALPVSGLGLGDVVVTWAPPFTDTSPFVVTSPFIIGAEELLRLDSDG